MRRGRVGGQMYRVLILALIIPMVIIGIVSVSILMRQMKDRYEEQLRAENIRIRSIVFDITSIVYTSLEPIISSQEYRDMFASDSYEVVTKGRYDALDAAVSSIIRTTAAISSINIYTNNPQIPTGSHVVNVGISGAERFGDNADKAAGSGVTDDSFSRFEWYNDIDNSAWDSYTCTHIPLNEHENDYELTLVRRFNTGSSENRAYIVVTVSTNYLRNRLLTTDNYMLISLDNHPVFFSSNYNEREIEMPEIEGNGVDEYNYMGDMMLDGKLALTCISSFVPYKITSRFYVLTGDYKAHEAIKDIMRGFILVLLLVIIVPLFIVILYSRYFTSRVNTLREAMHRASTGNYDIIENISGDDELADTFKDLKATTQQIREQEARFYETKIHEQQLINMQQNMEFKMLSGQINPHFLYNTLEAIRMQAIRGGDRGVATSVKYLAKIMHYVLESTGKSTATLAEELTHVESYLQIQRLRFGDRINWNFYIAEDFDISKYYLLPLLLQPIVENAVSHGLKDMDQNGHISIIVESEEEKLLITVNDDGKGMSPEQVEKLNFSINEKRQEDDEKGVESIGLYNINQRIKYFYGSDYGLTIRSNQGKGTSVELRLPINTQARTNVQNVQ
ncbi:sensor histidine kinase [Butyrivibrio sp. MC2021]|uniref:sensor histidine kinase n=1 Tax=Butyrivibrio sp. MC2021 TaxID=1408306 RepID=UPI00047A09A6|nr:histidine kinase [Butyrivibrio sp. MC2021]